MSDLISRSELIKELNKYCGNQRYLVSENIREIINNQPNAYSVDKVVEELEVLKRIYFLTIANTGDEKSDFAYENVGNAIDKAIEIVKQGGVSDDVCEWQSDCHLENDNPAELLISPHNPKRIFSTDIIYCPYCGKKIKAVEYMDEDELRYCHHDDTDEYHDCLDYMDCEECPYYYADLD